MNQTYIPSKDDSLENAIERMRSSLSDNGFNIVEHKWSNPAPNIWWVHIRDADNPMCFTNGKGGTKLAALASALGEFIERLSCNYFYADYHWGDEITQGDFVHYPDEKWFTVTDGTLGENCPNGLLNDELVTFYDPNNELSLNELHDINTGISERGICAIPFTCQRNLKTTYFPVNIIGNLYVSNGMSAGSTKTEARTQALSEIFERWVKNTIIADEMALPEIPTEVLARYPTVLAGIESMQAEGYLVKVFDVSLGGKFPVIGAALLNPADNGCLTSFGAHPNFAVALERTITEILQGRELKDITKFPLPSFDSDWIGDAHNLETHFIDSTGLVSWRLFSADKDYDFVDWDFSDNSTSECQFLLDLLHEQGADVYIADYEYLGVYACRVIVPSLSEIYPVEELTQYNNNVGNHVRELILQLPDSHNPDDFDTVLAWLDDSGLDDSERVSQVLGVSIETDNSWHFVRLGELRCYAYLALGEWDDALDTVEGILTFSASTMPTERQQFFTALREQLAMKLDDTVSASDYEAIHRELFGDAVYESVVAHVNDSTNCYDLNAMMTTDFINHQTWLKRYEIWQQVKKIKQADSL